MNWCGGQLEVVGVGLAQGKSNMAQQRARSSAMDILVHEANMALAPIRCDGLTLFSTVLENADSPAAVELRKTADEMIANIEIIDEIWSEAKGTYAVVGRVPLFGAQSLATMGIKTVGAFHPVEMPTGLVTITAPIPRGCTPQLFKAPYTGVIINGDDALLTPCMFPHVLRFDGKELWGPTSVTPTSLLNGSIIYTLNLDTALKQKLAGARPLILTGIGNGQNCYPVVNLDDVYLLLSQQKSAHLLERLPIIITLGKK